MHAILEPSFRSTPAQARFLRSYAEEFDATWFLYCSEAGRLEARMSFARTTAGADFDGPATAAEIRVARRLQSLGLLRDVFAHGEPGARHLSVVFTQAGAAALFDLAARPVGDLAKG